MVVKKIITAKDSEGFFKTDFNTIEDSFGGIIFSVKENTIRFDAIAINILRLHDIQDSVTFSLDETSDVWNVIRQHPGFFDALKELQSIELSSITVIDYLVPHFENRDIEFKLTVDETKGQIIINIIDYNILLHTEQNLNKFNSLLEAGISMFTSSTWWIDKDKHDDAFFQTDAGPKVLGIDVKENMIYKTSDFKKVRDIPLRMSDEYKEYIEAEELSYNNAGSGKSDYFAGRTPAIQNNQEILWVELYGKVLLRFPDGRPRFVAAIDIYMNDLLEKNNQVSRLKSLVDFGLLSSNIGIMWYEKHFNQGVFSFSNAYIDLISMGVDLEGIKTVEYFDHCRSNTLQKYPEYKQYFDEDKIKFDSVFKIGTDKYNSLIPKALKNGSIQWLEVRGTVIERDNDGAPNLIVCVLVDVTESINKAQLVKELEIENAHLQRAEKLAIKSGSVMVWYQDVDLFETDKYFFGNDVLVKNLGIERSKEGLIRINDYRKTIYRKDEESNALGKDLLKKTYAMYSNKIDSIEKLLAKHISRVTGEIYYYEHTIEVEERFPNGDVKLIAGFMRDVTSNIEKQKRITYLANTDLLTGLNNRNYFENFISENKLPSSYSISLFDVDGLKLINDAFGHLEGDKMIKEVSAYIKESFKPDILCSRIGGDEFIAISTVVNEDTITKYANDLEAKISEFNIDANIKMSVSKGAQIVLNESAAFYKAFVDAENLMYRRKLNQRSSRKSKTLESIIETLNAKTEETKEHSDRIAHFAVKTLKEMGHSRASEIEDMRLLARVHDIGKITVPDAILNKPSKLNEEEYAIVKKHSEAGYKITKNIIDSDRISEGVLYHHERFDGSGYPRGLSGKDIPLFAKIISVIDSYDAMTNERIYSKTKTIDQAISELKRCSGNQFDPDVIEAFLVSCFPEKQ